MDIVFREPLFYVFFAYGASFLTLSFVVFYGMRKATTITLITIFYALVLFGLTHGITELIDWVRFILSVTGTGEIGILKYLSQIFLITSFVILLQFGVSLLTYRTEKMRLFRLIPVVLFAVYVAALLMTDVADVIQAGLMARYSFGFPGALLSSIALFKLSYSMRSIGSAALIKGLFVCATGFALYAVFGGLVTRPIAGFPVQLFRTACALTIAISSFHILDVFKVSE